VYVSRTCLFYVAAAFSVFDADSPEGPSNKGYSGKYAIYKGEGYGKERRKA